MKPVSDALAILSALLSSSCCVIQLILNLFSVSCAGFSVFTPYRTMLTTLTVIILGYKLYKQRHLNNRKSDVITTVIAVLLMISPEITKWANQTNIVHQAKALQIEYVYRILVSGMSCEACANRIKNKFNSMDWISNARIFFENSTAILQSPLSTLNAETIIDTLKSIDTKYSAQVLDSWTSTSTTA